MNDTNIFVLDDKGGFDATIGNPPWDVIQPNTQEFYLGLTEVGKKKSYRDIKHYKRRKRWLT